MDNEKLDIGKLNQLYSDSESIDKEMFSEMRSNVLLQSGKHYSRTSAKIFQRLKDTRVDEKTKIRLVKNHVQKITKAYINSIASQAPGVRAVPHAETELQDSKAAEICQAVWMDAKARHNLSAKVRQWIEHFVILGEACCKIFWDPTKGKLIGYEQEVEEGRPVFVNQMGQDTLESHSFNPLTGEAIPHEPKKSDRAVYSGDFVFETVLPFNLLRDKSSETIEDSRYLIIRKMVDIEKVKALVGKDEEKLKHIKESTESTFKVFDGTSGDFVEAKNQVMLREYFFRPCPKYPEGWYVLATETGILVEIPLPFGIWPIAWAGFENTPTTPRAHSIIRHLRPYQGEINRCGSAISTTQQTMGDDKLIIQAGSKVQQGASLPGVRVISVSGMSPTILNGRSGDQYFAYLQAQISEMYQVANLQEEMEEIKGQTDPNTLLFRSIRQKKKFSQYASTIEDFLKNVMLTFLKLAQQYYPDDMLIRAIGRREAVNIQEFKGVSELDFAIKLEPVGEDVESMLGKSLQLQQILQYVGKDLPEEARGQIIAAMPFLNGEQMFGDLTLDSKNADSDILAMDRGEFVPAQKYENHKYIIKRLVSRMKMKDFKLLPPQVQQMYEEKIKLHEDMEAQELQQMKAMQSQFIPSGGAHVKVDFYVPSPNNPARVERATVPAESIDWLIKQLATQGSTQEQFQQMNQGAVADIARAFEQQAMNGMNGSGALNMPQQMPMMGGGNYERSNAQPGIDQLPANF